MKALHFLALILIIGSCRSRSVNDFTLKAQRDSYYAEKICFIDSVFHGKPDITNEPAFAGAFWASELMLVRDSVSEQAVRWGLNHFAEFSPLFRRSLLQHVYTLYHPDFISIIDSLIKIENDEKLFAMMAEYILLGDTARLNGILALMKRRFPEWKSHPVLQGMILNHSGYDPVSSSELEELIRYRENANEATLYVIVNRNRDLPGYAIIQKSDGRIIKRNNDTLRIKLLARSITNMPGYLTNGNTPTGVFSMQSISNSDNIFIGPTPALVTFLPFEISLEAFSFGRQKSGEWTIDDYDRFFPKGWCTITQKNMAFFAGKAGRSEIIIHGTTIDEEYYRSQTYFPFTPSLGCFCTLERWDRESGVLKESEQMKLVKTLKRNRIEKALVYLMEQ